MPKVPTTNLARDAVEPLADGALEAVDVVRHKAPAVAICEVEIK